MACESNRREDVDPARPHRTVERITRILELVASHPGGYTLTEIATKLDDPKSSIQGFVNGLVDTGYLEELDKRYFLGAAPYMLTLRADRMPARNIRHCCPAPEQSVDRAAPLAAGFRQEATGTC
ncbi:helix-turn-helix domain-containing protein [Streptomyces sp. CLV115]|uniref:helix-turn-helix domain-containing protein n=1 Tax=Streptomyces sp. CLV115 TaxID=3138502 RepID=UPI00313CAE83